MSGKNTHLSVNVAVTKSEYDAMLPWPFIKKVRFTLIDQQEDPVKQQNYTRHYITGYRPGSFARPVKEENAEDGFPLFIPHDELHTRRYLVDDALFLQVEISPL